MKLIPGWTAAVLVIGLFAGPASAADKPGLFLVVDDADAQLKGFQSASTASALYVEHGYLHDGNANKGEQTARFTPDLPQAGRYQVAIAYPFNANRASNVPVIIRHADGETKVTLDQKNRNRWLQ